MTIETTVMVNDNKQPCSPITEDVVQNVIAELLVDAPSSNVKDCIKAYEYGKNLKQLHAAFMLFSCEVITDTLNYLNVVGREEYVKSSNAQTLVCRIQNLLPDICGFCNDVYCVKNNDVSLLSCDMCGQEIHHKCLEGMISKNVAENDNISIETLTKNKLMKIVNPLGIPGWVYICNVCRKDHLPDENSGLKKKAKNANSQNNIEPPKNKDAEVTPLDGNKESEKGGGNEGDDHEKQSDDEKQPEDDKQPVCRFYLRKQCKHGMKGDGCAFSHPPICQKLLNFGHSKRGCKGKGCKSIHPKMCNHSLRSKECSYKNCKFYHVKGTKYVEEVGHKPDLTDHKCDETALSSEDIGNNFLGQKQCLESVKLEILEAMDIKIATLMSCLQPPPGFQRPPMSVPPRLANAHMQNPVYPPLHKQNMFMGEKYPSSYVMSPALQNPVSQGNSQHISHIPRMGYSPQQAQV